MTTVLMCLGGFGAVARADEARLLQRLSGTPLVSVADGMVATSVRSGHRYYLALGPAGSPVTRVAGLAGRPVPFDVDLGHNVGGDLVATYSRCTFDHRYGDDEFGTPTPELSRGCSIYEYDVRKKHERRIARATSSHLSRFLPARWGRYLAFVEHYDGHAHVAIRVIDLRSRVIRKVRGGTEFAGPPAGAVRTMDLRGQTLAFSWRVDAESCGANDDYSSTPAVRTEVWTQRVSGTRRKRLALGCTRDDNHEVALGAAVTPDGVAYAALGRGLTSVRVVGATDCRLLFSDLPYISSFGLTPEGLSGSASGQVTGLVFKPAS